MVGHEGRTPIARTTRARRMGGLPVLRPDLPPVPVPRGRSVTLLAGEVPGGWPGGGVPADRPPDGPAVRARPARQWPPPVSMGGAPHRRGAPADRALLR